MDGQRHSNGGTVVRWVMKMDSEDSKKNLLRYGTQKILLERLKNEGKISSGEYSILLRKLKEEYNFLKKTVDKEGIN